jgi:hypothetical protein
MNIAVIHEVWSDTVGAQLGLQWCEYPFPSGTQYGYRFIWRDDQGRLQPDRGQAVIPTAADVRADSEGNDGRLVCES